MLISMHFKVMLNCQWMASIYFVYFFYAQYNSLIYQINYKIMNYSNLTEIQRIIMGLFSLLSLFMGLPTAIILLKSKNTLFSGLMQSLAISTSALYHLSEVLNQPIIIDQFEWHRLDNIFAQVCFGICFMKLLGLQFIKWPPTLFLIISTITQFIDPWNFSYTLYPILSYFLLTIILRIMTYTSYQINYNLKNLFMFLSLLGIGVYYMIQGLDQYEDYLRIKHALWHFFSGWSSWYLFKAAKVTKKSKQYKIASQGS